MGLVVGEVFRPVADSDAVGGDGCYVLPLVGVNCELGAASGGILLGATSASVNLLVINVCVVVIDLPVDVSAEGGSNYRLGEVEGSVSANLSEIFVATEISSELDVAIVQKIGLAVDNFLLVLFLAGVPLAVLEHEVTVEVV